MKRQQPKELPLYLTPEEAAAILRVDRRTVYEWLRTGKIKAVQFGRTWRIPRSSVIAEPKQTDS